MKTIAAIFAHPDDEAFGPGGTLAKLAQTYDVHLLCATKGHAGDNASANTQEKIFRIRTQELKNSAKILGIKKISFLGFRDGMLCNKIYHSIATKIETKLDEITPEILITFEPRGLSGHIDHMAMSMITTYVFHRKSYIKELWYFCLSEKHRSLVDNYFIYFPPGYKKSEINKTIDVSSVWDQKIEAIRCHASQKKDIETMVIPQLNQLPQEEYFIVCKK